MWQWRTEEEPNLQGMLRSGKVSWTKGDSPEYLRILLRGEVGLAAAGAGCMGNLLLWAVLWQIPVDFLGLPVSLALWPSFFFFFFLIFWHYIWLHQVLIATHRILDLHRGMQDFFLVEALELLVVVCGIPDQELNLGRLHWTQWTWVWANFGRW